VRTLRLAGVVVYVTYLVQVGLLMTVLPWSDVWSLLVVRLPPRLASLFDHPSLRGTITAFGVLHLLLLAAEVRNSAVRAAATQPDRSSSSESPPSHRP